ncbi:MAG: bifunctional phosphopantothenoylcysteine decarboxylase/phosphopantothenate--cysteine ligase CoaBC [Bacteroidales bacterium]
MNEKNILIGVSAGIAAYKTAYLIRKFTGSGANVKVIMTPMAKQFITPLTLATLSKNPVLTDFFNPENGDWNSHVDLGLWADAMIIAPATANTLAKMAYGIADNLLLTTYLSARCPVFFAPAMDMDMYNHPATQTNIEILTERGNHCIDAGSGELASGLIGKGRMAEPEEIFSRVENFFNSNIYFEGKKVLITAGPTYEAIDPVRFIGNYSSGKMGYAMAEAFRNYGAKVKLISGPVNIEPPKGVELIKVTTAEEMYNACLKNFSECEIAVMNAAVADYTPMQQFDKKVKREKGQINLELKPTKDIAQKLGELKSPRQVLVGFALETDNEIENAFLKLKKKNLDFIVLNSLKDEGAGFNHDTNKVTIIDSNNNITKFELKSKKEIAIDIIEVVRERINFDK